MRKIFNSISFDIMKDAFPLRGRRYVVFVLLTGILVAKTLPLSSLLPSDPYKMTLNYGALKIPANVSFNIFAISLTIAQHIPSTQSREADPGTLKYVK